MPTLLGTGVVKCPKCGLVTFDDLPQCPRCEASFALVRPLASASLDGSRHPLRDDPELRVKLRDRLHRARFDRRKQNANPLAAGIDPDAPDWFEPLPGDESDAAEAVLAAAPATRGQSEETPIVYSDDLSPDDDLRGGATTADAETDIEANDAEFGAGEDDEPEFDGDVPGFTDWREELRERLKRIRARREEERLAQSDDDELAEPDDDLTGPDAAEDTIEAVEEAGAAGEESGADVEEEQGRAEEEGAEEEPSERLVAPLVALTEGQEEDKADDEGVAPRTEVVGFGAAIAEPNEASEEATAATDDEAPDGDAPTEVTIGTAGDLIAQIVDGPGRQPVDFDVESARDAEDQGAEQDADFVMDRQVDGDAPNLDLDPAEGEPDEALSDSEVADEEQVAEASDERQPVDMTSEEPEAEAVIDLNELLSPPGIAPGLSDVEAAASSDTLPELDFDDVPPKAPPIAPELDLPAPDIEEDRELEWDDAVTPAATSSSTGPLGERAAAALCDLLVLTAIGSALVGAASSGTGLPFRQVLAEQAVVLAITWAIFAIGYSVFFVGSCGQTIGRMVMRLRVVGTDQFSVGFGRAGIRLAAWVVAALPLLAGVLLALRDPQRRGLHDRLSRTRVVKA